MDSVRPFDTTGASTRVLFRAQADMKKIMKNGTTIRLVKIKLYTATPFFIEFCICYNRAGKEKIRYLRIFKLFTLDFIQPKVIIQQGSYPLNKPAKRN